MSDSLPAEPGSIQAVPDLAASLAAVQQHLPAIAKDKTAKVPTKGGGEYSYTYADLNAISDAVLPKLAEHGLSFTSWPTLERGVFVLRYMLLHESGQGLAGSYPLGQVGNPQQMGSAITYARRYCLCAVVGIAPDDDDDGRSAVAMQQTDPELEEARAKVRGAWQFHYGDLNTRELAESFRAWSRGGDLWQAAPGQLRSYAAYLSALPKEDAGSDPTEETKPADSDRPMSGRQRGMLFALMGEVGLHDKGSQLQWINKQLQSSYESRGDLTAAHAKILIDALQQGVQAPDADA